MEKKKHYEVVAAIISKTIDGQKKIFCAQRPGPKPDRQPNESNFKWEFPGGKPEQGETHAKALVREIQEELGGKIKVGEFVTTVIHEYSDFHITMHVYNCELEPDSPDFVLKEHLDSKWLSFEELKTLEWAPADLAVVEQLTAKKEHLKIQFKVPHVPHIKFGSKDEK